MKAKLYQPHNGWQAKVISAGEKTLGWGDVLYEIEYALDGNFNIDNYEVVNVTEKTLILKDKDDEKSFVIFETYVDDYSYHRQSVATEWKQIKDFQKNGSLFIQYHDIFMGSRKVSEDEDVVVVDAETMTKKVIPIIKWGKKVSEFEDVFERVIGNIVGDDPQSWKWGVVKRFATRIMHSETDWDALDW